MTAFSRRRLVRAAGAASFTALAGWPAIGRAQATIALRFSSSMTADENAAHYVWYQRFQTNLKSGVGEAIKIDYFPNNQLGKESDIVQQVKVGSVDMMVSGSSIWATVLPEMGMLDLGYLFDSYAHVAKALEGPAGTGLAATLQQRSGCAVLTWASHFGPRSVYTKQPVHSLAEIKGVKLRVLPTPAFIETFKIMGAIPTPIPIGELYMAAQTGVVDGFEHDAATVLASKFDEVVKYCWTTEHLFSPMTVVMGKRSLDRIPGELRPGFMKAVADATAQQRTIAGEKGLAAVAELKRKGMTYAPMSAADRAAVRKEMEARLWSEFAKQYPATAPLFASIASARG
jgi:TRAP-type transport system periplasmic protein